MNDQKLEQQVSEYAGLAKDKNIDAAVLMAGALQGKKFHNVPQSTRSWAYLASVIMPIAGVIYAVWFLFTDYDDRRKVAATCFALSIITTLLVSWLI